MKQVLTTKNVIYLANADSLQARTKSVPNPSAQIAKVYGASEEVSKEIDRLLSSKESIKARSCELWYIIELLISSGARISEVLSISPVDIMRNGNVRVRGKKGSSDRIVVTRDSMDYMLRCRSVGKYPFQDWDRFRCYREFKLLGIGMRFPGKEKQSVTHFFRHAYNRMMKKEGIEQELRSSELGHKSRSNIKHYE